MLDEIYIDGLDSSQVFGQTKMVLDGVGEELLGSIIPEIQGMVRDEEEEEEDTQEEDTQEEEEPPAEEEEVEEVEEVEEELEQEEQPEDEESQVESEEEQPEEEEDAEPIHKDAFGLNDGFDIDEFNKQVLAMENDNNDDEIDYFDSLSGDDDEMDYYNDFYDKPGKFKQQVPEKGV